MRSPRTTTRTHLGQCTAVVTIFVSHHRHPHSWCSSLVTDGHELPVRQPGATDEPAFGGDLERLYQRSLRLRVEVAEL